MASDGTDLLAYVDQLEAKQDALRDELADWQNHMLKRFDERAAQSTDLYTWIRSLQADRDRFKKLVEADEGRVKQIVSEQLVKKAEHLEAERDALQKSLTATEDEMDELRNEHNAARAEILGLENDIENQLKTIAKQKTYIEELLLVNK